MIRNLSNVGYPLIKETSSLQVYLPSVLTDGLQVFSLFWLQPHFSSHKETVKMGLKSKEREHLLIRWLKPTANEPVTKHVLCMTDRLLG